MSWGEMARHYDDDDRYHDDDAYAPHDCLTSTHAAALLYTLFFSPQLSGFIVYAYCVPLYHCVPCHCVSCNCVSWCAPIICASSTCLVMMKRHTNQQYWNTHTCPPHMSCMLLWLVMDTQHWHANHAAPCAFCSYKHTAILGNTWHTE